MAKTIKINENISLNFGSREADSGDTVMDCNVSFDNPKDDSVFIHRLNTWLKAIGRDNIVVEPKASSKGS